MGIIKMGIIKLVHRYVLDCLLAETIHINIPSDYSLDVGAIHNDLEGKEIAVLTPHRVRHAFHKEFKR